MALVIRKKRPVTFKELPILALYVLESSFQRGLFIKMDDQESVSLVTRNSDYHHPDDVVLTHNCPVTANGFLMVVGEQYIWPAYASREMFTGTLHAIKFEYRTVDDMPKSKQGNIRLPNGDWGREEVIAHYSSLESAKQLSQDLFWGSYSPKVTMQIDGASRKQTYDHTGHFLKGIIY